MVDDGKLEPMVARESYMLRNSKRTKNLALMHLILMSGLVLFCTMVVAGRSEAMDTSDHPWFSIREAQEEGTFATVAHPSRLSVETEEQTAIFDECWLERMENSGNYFVCFTLFSWKGGSPWW